MEAEAFWGLFRDYEEAGGDGYMHTVVQPAMEKLRIRECGEEEYYSSVFTFDDWYLDKPVGTIAQQYDHLSRSLLVTGDLPDGYIWHMLIQCGDNFNIVLMEPIEDEKVGAVEDQPTEGSNDSNSADGPGATEATPDPSETPETPKKKLIGAILERGWVSESGQYSV